MARFVFLRPFRVGFELLEDEEEVAVVSSLSAVTSGSTVTTSLPPRRSLGVIFLAAAGQGMEAHQKKI